jgi:hypothetical protein
MNEKIMMDSAADQDVQFCRRKSVTVSGTAGYTTPGMNVDDDQGESVSQKH